MELILKNDVPNLGFKDDLVSVKNGYGRNYLIPQGLAILATTSSKKVFIGTPQESVWTINLWIRLVCFIFYDNVNKYINTNVYNLNSEDNKILKDKLVFLIPKLDNGKVNIKTNIYNIICVCKLMTNH